MLTHSYVLYFLLVRSPTRAMQVGGQQAVPAPDLCPRRIVLKMLAVSSSHSKMQISLSTERATTLLVACVRDSSQENVINALITLANIAQNVRSHSMVSVGVAGGCRGRQHEWCWWDSSELGLVKKFLSLCECVCV